MTIYLKQDLEFRSAWQMKNVFNSPDHDKIRSSEKTLLIPPAEGLCKFMDTKSIHIVAT